MNRFLIPALCIASSFMLGRSTADIDFGNLPFPSIVDIVPDIGPPVPGDGKHVAVIYQTEPEEIASMPFQQRLILDSVPLRQWMREQGFADGQGDTFQFIDADQEFIRGDWFKAAMALERTELPWVVVSNGKAGYSGPLPQNIDEFKSLLEKYK